VGGHSGDGPVYGVTAARDQLSREPAQWLGRALKVRGQIVPCLAMPSAENGACTAMSPAQSDPRRGNPAAPTTIDPMPLTAAGLNPFLASLRPLPLLAGLLPSAQLPPWGAIGIYRIQIGALPAYSCPSPPCYEALLLGAAP
jgi:hypothetical protein